MNKKIQTQFLTNARKVSASAAAVAVAMIVASCGGGSGGGDERVERGGAASADFNCDGNCPNQNLNEADVERILRQAVAGAQSLGVSATIAVLDRTSNVLGVYQMPGAATTSVVNGGVGAQGGLEGATVPAAFCAISKAGTASNFSSQGNAFGSRTANQLLQEHFDPGEGFSPSGPLFGVQISQGLCSDINTINPDFAQGLDISGKTVFAGLVGPRPQPIGFAADPGGLPLYKQGDMVGSIGVELDGLYSLDRNLLDNDVSLEEVVALSGSIGYEIPEDRQASRIFVRGKSLRVAELNYDEINPLPAALPGLEPGGLLVIPFFTNGQIRRGGQYGSPESGFKRVTRAGIEVEVVVDDQGNPRFPSKNGAALPGGVELKAAEVDAMLDASQIVAFKTRSQVRRPLDSFARLAVWIVDQNGDVVGYVRSKDTIVDSTDVTLQKARTVAFFSSPDASERLRAGGFGSYVDRAVEFFQGRDPFDGSIAWSDTALGNISRPFFPDGIDNTAPGPLSLPFPGLTNANKTWSIFNTGLQLDVYINSFLAPLGNPPVAPKSCTDQSVFGNRIRNGLTFFAGAFPLYRGNTLIGAISSSGDGTEQDDLIPFFAAAHEGLELAGRPDLGDPELGFNAPKEMRADTISTIVEGTTLRYVICPEAPFLGSNEQNVCEGL